MDKKKFIALVNKYLAGHTNPEEEEILFQCYDKLQEAEQEWDPALMGEKPHVQERLYQNILQEINRQERRKASLPARWAVAAALVLAICSSVLFLYLSPQHTDPPSASDLPPKAVAADIQPGGNKATLILADGSQINLDDASTGELARQSGISITKAANGQLVCTIASHPSAPGTTANPAYNTIETPKGGQYQIILPDGTKVWLNAASSLRFPSLFAGNERRVELLGEAYFEVAHNARLPFRVVCEQQVVEVLGTHFNISSYNDEAAVKTTLLEGAVQVLLPGKRVSERLKPGQQAIVHKSENAVLVGAVDVEEAVAWKNGYFMFVEEDLESVMRKLARWYNVEIEYQGPVENLRFGGMISRSKSISQALQVLELTGDMHFKIEGRRIIVMP